MREMKDSGIEWIGEIPADWTLQRGKTIFAQRLTKGNQSEILLAATQKYGMLPQSEVEGVVQVKEDADLQQFRTVHKKDFVISLRSFQGGFEYSQYEGVCSPAYQVFYNTNPICHNYYRLLFKSDGFIQKMKSMTVGIREGKNIQYSDFANSLIPVPPINQQQRIADYLDRKCSKIDAIIARQQEVIEKLKAYKLAVITEAVTKGLNPDVPMKDSGVEWIGEIPENWEIRRIGSFARVTSSKRIFEESYVDEGVPFYRSKEITDLSKGLHVQTEIFIPEEVFEQVNEASPAPKCGDILLTSIGTIGNTWISDGRKFYYKDGNITQIEANDSFDSAYVEYCFSSNVVLEQYTRLAMGSTLLALTIIKIKKILVAFPPLDEQRKIVQYLKLKCSSIDAAIKNKENLITKLVDYKKSLIYEVVTGKKEV